MRDVGFVTGVKALWHEDMRWDYTIKVEGQEFKAHKLVLASVSQYFKAMIGHPFKECKTNKVELGGPSADTISKLLEFIYTREERCITNDMSDVLSCAIYLQMSEVAEFCVNKMMKDLDVRNCLDTLSVLTEYSFHERMDNVKTFIKSNCWKVVECTKLAELSCDNLHLLLNYWQKSEWERFLFIKDWFSSDPEDRRDLINDVLSEVRFGLISQNKVKSITEMEIFHSTNGSWHDLVTAAVEYTNLPVHLRVINQTEQSTVRSTPRPVFFTTGEKEKASTFYSLDNDNQWEKHTEMALHTPTFTDWRPMGVAVNNFFVICNGYESNQEWHIFDPRTLTWSQIASVARPKIEFEMVHTSGHIYVLGGTYIDHTETEDSEIEETHETDRYSFLTNEWTPVCSLPSTIINPTACVIGDNVYVCDGVALYCLDLSSDDQGWEERASCLANELCQPMHVMTLDGEQVIVVIHLSSYSDELHIYNPSQNQWSMLEHPLRKRFNKVIWTYETMSMSDGNSVYLLALEGYLGELDDPDYYTDEDSWKVDVCMKCVIPENGNDMSEIRLGDFPISPAVHTFGALLAIPSHT